MDEVTCVLDAGANLGEGPVWSTAEQALYWADVFAPTLNRFDLTTGQNRTWTLPRPIGSFALREAGGAVLALSNGFHLFDFASGDATPIGDPEAELPANRFNDGKTDRRGRFWAGTLRAEIPETDPVGSLYRLDRDLRWSRHADGIVCSNGLGWSPDDRTMYFTDSRISTILAYDFDADAGTISSRRVFARFASGAGFPDGLTVDQEGGVWTALWDGWRVVRLTPDGRIDREIAIPCAKPTSCMFGGPDLATLYVTSASYGASAEDLSAYPLSGGIFAVWPDVCGLPESRFAG